MQVDGKWGDLPGQGKRWRWKFAGAFRAGARMWLYFSAPPALAPSRQRMPWAGWGRQYLGCTDDLQMIDVHCIYYIYVIYRCCRTVPVSVAYHNYHFIAQIKIRVANQFSQTLQVHNCNILQQLITTQCQPRAVWIRNRSIRGKHQEGAVLIFVLLHFETWPAFHGIQFWYVLCNDKVLFLFCLPALTTPASGKAGGPRWRNCGCPPNTTEMHHRDDCSQRCQDTAEMMKITASLAKKRK